MHRRHNIDRDHVVSEMAIVDTFTKLIFGTDEGYSPTERAVIHAFRAADENVHRDTPAEMGEYLRNLGVREMIQLVAGVRRQMQDSYDLAASRTDPVNAHPGRHSH